MFSLAYALIPELPVLMLALVLVHGVFWSGLLSASAAYMTNMLPESRRAEGIGYWGLSTIAAIAVAPSIGFWIYRSGWLWLCVGAAILNLMMAVIAWRLPDHPVDAAGAETAAPRPPARVARARPLGHAVPVLVRLRRHHELHGAVRRRERRHAARAST